MYQVLYPCGEARSGERKCNGASLISAAKFIYCKYMYQLKNVYQITVTGRSFILYRRMRIFLIWRRDT